MSLLGRGLELPVGEPDARLTTITTAAGGRGLKAVLRSLEGIGLKTTNTTLLLLHQERLACLPDYHLETLTPTYAEEATMAVYG